MSPNERKKKVAELIAALCETFNRQPTEATFKVYEIGLSDISLADIERAFLVAIRELRFMPTVSELRTMAATGTAATVDDLASHAFSVLSMAVSRVGAYKSPDFSDALINATVRALGGWESVCEKPASIFDTFFRKDFIDQYKAFYRTGVSADEAAPLMGIFDRDNGLLGYQQTGLRKVECGIGHNKNAVRLPHFSAKPPAAKPLLELKKASGDD